MKRFLALLATGALATGLAAGVASTAHAQTRGVGAGALVLDDNNGHKITIVTPHSTDPDLTAYNAWVAAGGNLIWNIPVPPVAGAQEGFIMPGHNGLSPNIQLPYWVYPNTTGINGELGGQAGTWAGASTAQLGLLTSTTGTVNTLPKFGPSANQLTNSGISDNGVTITAAEPLALGTNAISTVGAITSTGDVTTSGNLSTTGTGTMTSAGLLTGSSGLAVTGASNLNGNLLVSGSLANTAANPTDGNAVGHAVGAVTWTGNGVGYAMDVENLDATALTHSNGLLVRTQGTDASHRVINANAGGTDLFAVLGDGTVHVENNSLDMHSHTIVNVTDPVGLQDASTKNYVDNSMNAAVNGTANSVPVFTSAHVIGNSSITDDGTTVTTAKNVQLGAASGNSNTFGSDASNNYFGTGSLSQTNTAVINNWIGDNHVTSAATVNNHLGDNFGNGTNGASTITTIIGRTHNIGDQSNVTIGSSVAGGTTTVDINANNNSNTNINTGTSTGTVTIGGAGSTTTMNGTVNFTNAPTLPLAQNNLYVGNAAGHAAATAPATNSVLVTDAVAGGTPQWATTLPTSLTVPTATITNPTITTGSINNTPIGASVPNTGAFTSLGSSGLATLNSLNVTNAATVGNALTVSAGGAAITGNSTITGNATVTGSLSNTGGNILDQGLTGLNGNSINWQVNANGYAVGIENNNAALSNPNGLLVRTAKATAGTRVFNANAGGTDLFAVLGDGTVHIENNSLDMHSHTIVNVTDPVGSQDAATKNYVDNTTNTAITGTANTMTKFTAAHTVGNSLLTDNGTTLSYNAGKFTVTAATGNTTVAGTLGVTGAMTGSSVDLTGAISTDNLNSHSSLGIAVGDNLGLGGHSLAGASTIDASSNISTSGGALSSGAGSTAGLLLLNSGGATPFTGTLQTAALTGTQSYTLPDASGTLTVNGLLLSGGTMSGNIDMGTHLISNIGAAGTGFTAGGNLNVGGTLGVTGATTLSALNTNGVVHATGGTGVLASSLVVNADVSGTAAIAGTKISPDFGNQNVATTGNITTSFGGNIAVTGSGTLSSTGGLTVSAGGAAITGATTINGALTADHATLNPTANAIALHITNVGGGNDITAAHWSVDQSGDISGNTFTGVAGNGGSSLTSAGVGLATLSLTNSSATPLALAVTGNATVSGSLSAGSMSFSGNLDMANHNINNINTLTGNSAAINVGNALAMGSNNITTTGTVSTGALTASGATTLSSFVSAGVVHNAGGGLLSSSQIVDADVSGTAAISGSKINPNFGAQNVVTTGTLGAGATTLTGDLGMGTHNITGTGTISATTFNGALTGNASTATKLSPGNTINGVSFDGSAAITVAAAAGTLTGNTLAAGVVNSSLTSVGTLANLTVTNPIAGSVTGNAANVTGIVGLANGGTGVDNSTGIAQNAVFAGPSSGGPGTAGFRALAASDIPSLSGTYLALSGGTMTGNLAMGANNITGTGTVSAGTFTGGTGSFANSTTNAAALTASNTFVNSTGSNVALTVTASGASGAGNQNIAINATGDVAVTGLLSAGQESFTGSMDMHGNSITNIGSISGNGAATINASNAFGNPVVTLSATSNANPTNTGLSVSAVSGTTANNAIDVTAGDLKLASGSMVKGNANVNLSAGNPTANMPFAGNVVLDQVANPLAITVTVPAVTTNSTIMLTYQNTTGGGGVTTYYVSAVAAGSFTVTFGSAPPTGAKLSYMVIN